MGENGETQERDGTFLAIRTGKGCVFIPDDETTMTTAPGETVPQQAFVFNEANKQVFLDHAVIKGTLTKGGQSFNVSVLNGGSIAGVPYKGWNPANLNMLENNEKMNSKEFDKLMLKKIIELLADDEEVKKEFEKHKK